MKNSVREEEWLLNGSAVLMSRRHNEIKEIGVIHRTIWMANELFGQFSQMFGLHNTSLSSIWKHSEEWLNAPSFFWVSLVCSGRVKLLILLTPGKFIAWKNNNLPVPNYHSSQQGQMVCVSNGIYRIWPIVWKAVVKLCDETYVPVSVFHTSECLSPSVMQREKRICDRGRIFHRNELHKASYSWYREIWF